MRGMQELLFWLGGLRWDTLSTQRFQFFFFLQKKSITFKKKLYRITSP